ncbi:response regulator transcription factor [bacterium SCSIO 12741]|nr:response regulator transcription factor [bacterium SCSIO 12741]
MYSLALIDDEPRVRSLLRSLIEEHYPWITIVGEAQSVESGLQLIRSEVPDILLLDVEMQDGSGFDLINRLDRGETQVIFVTAFDHYAIKAIRSRALDYLEKPVNPMELGDALLRARSELQKTKPFKDNEPSKNRLSIPTGSGMRLIDFEDISYIQADGSYSEIYLVGESKPIVVSRKLKALQQTLTPLGFIRPNHSNLVNLQEVKEVHKTDGGFLTLRNGKEILLTKSYKDASLSALKNFAHRLG